MQSDVILLMTCSVREGAEQKIWKRLEFVKSLKLARQRMRSSRLPPVKIGILGRLYILCAKGTFLNNDYQLHNNDFLQLS